MSRWTSPAPPPPPCGPPNPHQSVAIGNSQLGHQQRLEKVFWLLVKGSKKIGFRPMFFYPKCSKLNAEFKLFFFPHHLGLGLLSHIDFSPLWGP